MLDLENKALRFFQTLGLTYPTTRRHIPVDLVVQESR